MADQPQPDWSQSQQFAPGFQPQVPIPGIQSSYPQQQQQPNFNQSQAISQQADAIVYQSTSNAKMTMALVQQNLMNSMHNALLGGLTAFSDVSRRGSSMITAMSPAGQYNDMLAPNQNWALESSFRREAGFGVGKFFGLDPYNSVTSRLLQGRRPEFLTEGEYSQTMGFASKLRQESLMTTLKSVGASTALGYAAGFMGPIPGIGAMVLGGMTIDRAFEAAHMEHEDLLRQQMIYRNKRVGIGQQYISSADIEKVHGAFYEQENPFAARFFGDTAVGNAFRPDVSKLKVFTQAADAGLFANEGLDADSVIKHINRISKTVEEFSRIGKVTRDVSVKLMGDLKASGINGNQLFTDYASSALTSSVTGIDMQTLVGIKGQAARQGAYLGYDTFSASQSIENNLSGFAMMKASGMFRQKDIMRLAQVKNEENTGKGTQDMWDLYLRFGGDMQKVQDFLAERGGNSVAQGFANLPMMNLPVVDHTKAAIDIAIAKGARNWSEVYKKGGFKLHPELLSNALGIYLGSDKLEEEQKRIGIARSITGKDLYTKTILDFGGDNQYSAARDLYSRVQQSRYNAANDALFSGLGPLPKLLIDTKLGGTKQFRALKNLKLPENPTLEDMDEFASKVHGLFPIDENNRFSPEIEALLPTRLTSVGSMDRRTLVDYLTLKANPTAYGKITRAMISRDANTELGQGIIRFNKMYGNQVGPSDVTAALEFTKRLSPEQQGVVNKAFLDIPNYKMRPEEDKNAAINNFLSTMKAAGIETKELEFGITHGNWDMKSVYARINAVASNINSNYLDSRGQVFKLEAGEAKRAGMKLEDYRAGYQPLADFFRKYQVTAESGVDQKFIENGDMNKNVRMELAAILSSKDKNVQKYIASTKIEHPERFAEELRQGTPMANLAPGLIKTLMAHHEDMDTSLQEAVNKIVKTSTDPSGAAIDTLNEILGKILKAMGVAETPVAAASPKPGIKTP